MTAGEKTRKDAKSLVSSIQICHNPTGFGSKMKIDCSETDLYSRQSVSKETCRSTNTGRVRISLRTIWPQQEQRRHFEKSLNRKLISGETLGRACKRGIHLEGQRGNRNKFTKKCICSLRDHETLLNTAVRDACDSLSLPGFILRPGKRCNLRFWQHRNNRFRVCVCVCV